MFFFVFVERIATTICFECRLPFFVCRTNKILFQVPEIFGESVRTYILIGDHLAHSEGTCFGTYVGLLNYFTRNLP